MRQMLKFNPQERITVREALEHPFLRDFHRQCPEPVCDTMFDYNFEKKGNTLFEMTEAEVRACIFEEACHYRTYGNVYTNAEVVRLMEPRRSSVVSVSYFSEEKDEGSDGSDEKDEKDCKADIVDE